MNRRTKDEGAKKRVDALAFPANTTRRSFLAGSAAFAALLLSGCGTSQPKATESTQNLETMSVFAFDTLVNLSIYGDREVLKEAAAACARWNQLFSAYNMGSDVWRINHAKGKACSVDPDTADLIARSMPFCEASNGLFDPTIGSVSLMWDFKRGVVPESSAIREAMGHVDWRGVDVQGNMVRMSDPDAALDFGGIAKGWIADRLATLFRQRGVSSGLIDLGGNVYALGTKPDGEPWLVGIADPARQGSDDVVSTVQVADCSVVTSGAYERSFVDSGTEYGHILDTATGYPSRMNVASSTVVSNLSLDGDGLATILALEGATCGLERVNAMNGVEALFVESDGTLVESSGFGSYASA